MSARLCILCLEQTYNNYPFCHNHYLECGQDAIDGIYQKPAWYRFLVNDTAKETRRRGKERIQLEHGRYE
jgi:hypothetical protein